MGSALWPRRLIFFPPQNYHSQSIGSALRASPFASLGAFARKQNKCRLGPTCLAFRALQMHQVPIFCSFEVRLAVSDVLCSTPTTPSVNLSRVIVSHTRTVVRECFKGDEASQWKRPKFDPSPHQNPLTDLHKNWRA